MDTKMNRCLLTGLFCILILQVYGQEQLTHEKKIYVGPDQKVYINKNLPVYFKVSLSPDEKSPSYILPGKPTEKYANPMYFDTEGLNTLRSPSAVDPVTKQVIMPKRDILFGMFADGKPPITKLKLTHSSRHIKNKTTFYNKGITPEFESNDATSGVDATYVSVNASPYQEYSKVQLNFDQEKEYIIKYYSVDRVGNAEVPRSETFSIDNTAPITSFTIIGQSKGKMLSSKASIALSSKDTLSGISRILYSINESDEKVYTAPIPLSVLKDGKSKIKYYAIDNVGNKEEVKVISANTEEVEEKTDLSSYSFYIDKEPPVIGLEIEGDQFKGKYLYISKDSHIKINANDDKSGVAKIMYSIDNALLGNNYEGPFVVDGEGLHTISYAAVDNVGNLAMAKTQQVYVDKHTPISKISFKGHQFVNRDTLFITSETKISISTNEIGSGIQSTEYVLDNTKYSYSSPIEVSKEGFHTLEYFSRDNVTNTEANKKTTFFVDNISPKIIFNFSVKAIGEKSVRDEKYTIYPSNAMLYIAATDNASGGEKLEYRINKGAPQNLIPLKGLAPGNYEVEIHAYDALKNKSSLTIRFSIED